MKRKRQIRMRTRIKTDNKRTTQEEGKKQDETNNKKQEDGEHTNRWTSGVPRTAEIRSVSRVAVGCLAPTFSFIKNTQRNKINWNSHLRRHRHPQRYRWYGHPGVRAFCGISRRKKAHSRWRSWWVRARNVTARPGGDPCHEASLGGEETRARHNIIIHTKYQRAVSIQKSHRISRRRFSVVSHSVSNNLIFYSPTCL